MKKQIAKRIFSAAVAAITAFSMTSCVMAVAPASLAGSGQSAVAYAPSATARKVTVKSKTANIRSGAGTSHSVIGRASKGKSYVYLGSKKDSDGKTWYQIQYTSTKVGWILSSLGKLTEETDVSSDITEKNGVVTVTGNTLNVRADADTSAEKIGSTRKGAQFKYLGSKKDASGITWYRIQYTSSKTGWVISSYAKLSAASQTNATTEPTSSQTKATAKTTAAAKTKYIIISGNPVNVRSGAGTSYEKIGSVSKGKKFKMLSSKKDSSGKLWYEIQYNASTKGWVMASLSYIEGTAQKKSSGKIAYLTFDDGPSINTYKILDILDKYNVKATFFVIYHSGYKKQYQAIVKRGHTIALHSYTHNYSKIYKDEKGYFADLKKIHDYIEDVTGVDSNIIRFPGGSSNTVSNKYNKGIMKTLKTSVEKKGYVYHDWNVDSTDAAGRNRKASLLLSNVKKGAKNKKVIDVLMHDTGKSKKTTVQALPSIIEYLRKQGYSFEALTPDTKPIQHGRK